MGFLSFGFCCVVCCVVCLGLGVLRFFCFSVYGFEFLLIFICMLFEMFVEYDQRMVVVVFANKFLGTVFGRMWEREGILCFVLFWRKGTRLGGSGGFGVKGCLILVGLFMGMVSCVVCFVVDFDLNFGTVECFWCVW
jgi:hypothetical protein